MKNTLIILFLSFCISNAKSQISNVQYEKIDSLFLDWSKLISCGEPLLSPAGTAECVSTVAVCKGILAYYKGAVHNLPAD